MTRLPAPVAKPKTTSLAPALLAAGALGGLAVYNYRAARKAEARNRPQGQWVCVDGVPLHYIVKGDGPALTLIHGNLTLGEDFVLSGLVDRLSERFRVFVFNRPGYGYSERPGRFYTPSDYARLLRKALETLGVESVVAVGHSFGALVAMALALDHEDFVERVAVIGGYFYPSPRLDVALFAPPAAPILGDLMRFTLSPALLRLMQPALFRLLFAPAPPPARFLARFPRDMTLRPSQIRAQAEDAAVMVPAAAVMQGRYRSLTLPVTIIAGADDRWVDQKSQSGRLHEDIPKSRYALLPGVGHMAHYTALAEIAALLDAFAPREPVPAVVVSTAEFLVVRSRAAQPGDAS